MQRIQILLKNSHFFIKSLLIIIALFSLLIFLRTLTLNYYPDFNTYYYGTVNLLKGVNPYIPTENMFAAFIYPPPSFIFFTLLTLFSYGLSEKVFALFSVVCFLASIGILFRIFKVRFFTPLGLVIIIALLNFFPEKFTLGMGQFNNIILVLTSLFLLSYLRKKDYLAGVFLGLAISLKLFPVLLIIYLIIDRRWKIIFSTGFVFATLYILSYFYVGNSIAAYFLHSVMPSLIGSQVDAYYNQSLMAFLNRSISDVVVARIIGSAIGMGLLIMSSVVILKYKKPNTLSKILCMSNLITLNIILNSIAWQHHYIWLIIPFLATLFYLKDKKMSAKYYFFLILSFLLVSANLRNPSGLATILQSHVFYGAILLYFLQLHLLLEKGSKDKQ